MDTPDVFATAEATQIYWWHLDYFKELGFRRHQAEILIFADVDPHDADDLLKHGCSFEQALDILT